MLKPHDDSKACLTAFVQDNTLTVVIEMSLASWLVAGTIPGVDREPRKKIGPDPEVLLQLLYRWRDEAEAGAKAALGGKGAAAGETEKDQRIRQLERTLGRKSLEIEILKNVVGE